MTDKINDALIIAGEAADTASTIVALKDGAKESNPILGSNPSTTKLVIVKGASAGIKIALVNKLEKKHPKLARTLSFILGGVGLAAATHNARVIKNANRKRNDDR